MALDQDKGNCKKKDQNNKMMEDIRSVKKYTIRTTEN